MIRSWWRHEQRSFAAVVETLKHHSASRRVTAPAPVLSHACTQKMDLFSIDTDDEEEQDSMKRVIESVHMNERVEPETLPVTGRVFDEMARVRDVSQNMVPILLNQNVEIVDFVRLERISAGFLLHMANHQQHVLHVGNDTLDWTCCARASCRRFCAFMKTCV